MSVAANDPAGNVAAPENDFFEEHMASMPEPEGVAALTPSAPTPVSASSPPVSLSPEEQTLSHIVNAVGDSLAAERIASFAPASCCESVLIGMTLSLEHAALLTARAIDLQLASIAGLATVDCVEGANLLGRAEPLESGALAIPYPGVSPPYTRLRMDAGTPRYLIPSAPVPVYVPPGIDANGKGRLFVVEGPLKALAFVSASLDAVALGGVTTTLEKGEPPRLNSSWSALSLSGRPVTIVFDANRLTKPMVAHGEAKLGMALEAAGANVSIAELPPGPGGIDWGPDDFLAANGVSALIGVLDGAVPAEPAARVQQLEVLADGKRLFAALLGNLPFLAALHVRGASASAALKTSCLTKGLTKELTAALKGFAKSLAGKDLDSTASTFGAEYAVVDGQLSLQVSTPQGPTMRSICNFDAKIVEEVVETDGEHESRSFVLEGTIQGEPLPRIIVSPEALGGVEWVVTKWGARPNVSGERSLQVHLRPALQSLSTPIVTRLQTCTGWLHEGGYWTYAHGGGVISSAPLPPLDEVRLVGPVARYVLPNDTTGLQDAMAVAKHFCSLVDGNAGLLLLAAAFRAPLNEARLFPGVVFLVGRTGTFKTSVAELVQAFFGEFNPGAPAPASWNDTLAAIEHAAFMAKDALLLIDDLAPRTSDIHDDHRNKASHVIRNAGNGTARQRMTPAMKAQRSYPPRALILVTGEDMPREESILARSFVIPFRLGVVDLKTLTKMQAGAACLAAIMRAYLEWLASRFDAVAATLEARLQQLAVLFATPHARTARLAAELLLGLEIFLEFAVDTQTFSAQEADAWRAAAISSAQQLAAEQGRMGSATDPVRNFLEVAAELVKTGKLVMSSIGGARHSPRPGTAAWSDHENLYFLPRTVFGEVADAMKATGERMPLSQAELLKRLVDLGIAKGDADRPTVKRAFAGGARVLSLTRHAVEKFIDADFPSGDDPPVAG